jgi:hypothetical protein
MRSTCRISCASQKFGVCDAMFGGSVNPKMIGKC